MSADDQQHSILVAALERSRAALEHHLEYAKEHGVEAMSRHLHNEASIATRVLAENGDVLRDEEHWVRVRNLGRIGGHQ
jgi:limonene-1,2-epoxide hydrolase